MCHIDINVQCSLGHEQTRLKNVPCMPSKSRRFDQEWPQLKMMKKAVLGGWPLAVFARRHASVRPFAEKGDDLVRRLFHG